jgi:hypothetical protein
MRVIIELDNPEEDHLPMVQSISNLSNLEGGSVTSLLVFDRRLSKTEMDHIFTGDYKLVRVKKRWWNKLYDWRFKKK